MELIGNIIQSLAVYLLDTANDIKYYKTVQTFPYQFNDHVRIYAIICQWMNENHKAPIMVPIKQYILI